MTNTPLRGMSEPTNCDRHELESGIRGFWLLALLTSISAAIALFLFVDFRVALPVFFLFWLSECLNRSWGRLDGIREAQDDIRRKDHHESLAPLAPLKS